MKATVLAVGALILLMGCNAAKKTEAKNDAKIETVKEISVPGYLTDIVEGEITRFSFNGLKCEINGKFNFEYTDEPMWTLRYSDIERVEKLINQTIVDKKTYKGHPDVDPGLIEVMLTEEQVAILSKAIRGSYYRQYEIGSNKAYNTLIDVAFYDSDKADYDKKVVVLHCDLDNNKVTIGQ